MRFAVSTAPVPPLLVPVADLSRYGIHFSPAGLARAIKHGFPKPIAIVEGGSKLAFVYADLVAYFEQRKLHAEVDAEVRRATGARILEARRRNPAYNEYRRQAAQRRGETRAARDAAKRVQKTAPVEGGDELARLAHELGMPS
ncbi:MAG: hypothetical protein ACLQME_11005 [Alphaproteobacteria bacterium]